MKLAEFIKTFSHNNEVYVENRLREVIYFKYNSSDIKRRKGFLMDWELRYTDLAEIEVLGITFVYGREPGITIILDTEVKEFNFLPDKIDDAPLWLKEKVKGVKEVWGEA